MCACMRVYVCMCACARVRVCVCTLTSAVVFLVCLRPPQMAKMLDVLESFLNLHAHTYMRLDGSTKPEQRQILMQVRWAAATSPPWRV